ncbi:MAG TPA: carbohydrate ABC transporter permease [bacterium]|nr:carbohydrate ABC transporter permease [bacterium]
MNEMAASPRWNEAGLRRRPAPIRRRLSLHVMVIAICLMWLVPTVGVLVNSFRPARLVAAMGWWTALLPPFRFTTQNYADVLETYGLGQGFLNSLVITLPATVIPVAMAALTAYALAWMPLRGRGFVVGLFVGALAVPLQLTLVPVFEVLTRARLIGTFPAAWLAHTAYGLPLATYLLHNVMAALPRDLIESAAIDGATPVDIFARVVLPLCRPALASLIIFQFLWVWNDLLIALIFVGGKSEVAPMTVVVSNLANSLGQDWQLLTAGTVLSMMIPIAVFFAFQRGFIRGVLAGALKG